MIQINASLHCDAKVDIAASRTVSLCKSLYANASIHSTFAFRLANIDFLLNAFDDEIEFIIYSPIEVFPFLGHHRGKAAMAKVLKSGYEEFEFVTYEPVFMVCEAEDAAVIVFARFIHRRTGRSISVMIAHFIRFRRHHRR